VSNTKTRGIDLEALTLDEGGHDWLGNGDISPDQRMCVMEAVSWVAGEKWSDHPKCVSPAIGAFLRSWNDGLDADGRQKLKPYIERVLDTVGTPEQEQVRGLMAADWFIHHHLPAWLELAGIKDVADKIRALPTLDSWDAVEAATPELREAQQRASAARSAAWSAARSAAWSAAWSAARSAAWSAAESAARSAARSAATEVFKPTTVSLQASAFDLLDRMIAVTGDAA
jgi:hypothetical protein